MFKRLLTVCTGNICRSPLAESLLLRRLAIGDVKVESAGIAAMIGMPADPFAQEVAADNGLDISAHRARQLTRELIASSDLLLVLDETHEQWITRRFPEFRGKTFRLGKWNNNRNIADPYRQPKSAFEHAMREIEEDVVAWTERLLKKH